jgi:hypothetical protein
MLQTEKMTYLSPLGSNGVQSLFLTLEGKEQ